MNEYFTYWLRAIMKNLYLASLLSFTAESFRQATSSKTEPLFKFWWKTNCKAAYARLKQGRKYRKIRQREI